MQRELVRPYYFTDNERLPQYLSKAALGRRTAVGMGGSPKALCGTTTAYA
jgi:hypothetical protein